MKRLFEELFPFVFFYFHSKRILRKAAYPGIGNKDGEYGLYHQLDEESLTRRLREEHERAKSIDEKTVKFTVSISIALTILGSIGGYYSKMLDNGTLKLLVSSISGLSVLYTIMGGVLALGALRTLPLYGYGTDFVLKSKDNDEVKIAALAAQEKVNLARHLRNEAAYQCLRNGLIILMVSVVLFIAAPFLKTENQKMQLQIPSPENRLSCPHRNPI
ncbi:MAG: hypothetical protein PHQ35_10185 [Phycisphaerae bacterium]|nr:hypothetical protein [Phycisphaerae bacterium]MDD5381978.1 hypothetical protein [Phycisphaerae bacterium]